MRGRKPGTRKASSAPSRPSRGRPQPSELHRQDCTGPPQLCGDENLGPGRHRQHHPGHLEVDHNLANYIDKIVLGRHNYAGTKTWDPEGIVSTIPAISR